MRIGHCKYVIAVAETCNISQAADKLYITQQGLSQAIRALERELDVQIFHRTGNSLFPTAEGLVVIEKLKRIVSEYEELNESLKNISTAKREREKTLSIYATPNVVYSILSKILTVLFKKENHPEIKIVEALPLDIVESLANKDDGIALMTIPEFLYHGNEHVRDGTVMMDEVARCPLMAYVSQSSEYAERDLITSEIIRSTPLAIFPSEINMVAHILDDDSIEPNIMINSSNQNLYRDIVSKTNAIGFTTTLFERNTKALPFTLIPLEKQVEIYWGCMYNHNRKLSFWEREAIAVFKTVTQPNGKTNT